METKTEKSFDYPELTFEEKKHVYKLNGVVIPSVTTVMKPLSNELYKTVDENALNKAAARGTAVHNSIENYIKYDIEDIEPVFEPYFLAFLDWFKRYNPKIIASEVKLYHRFLRYAGTADLLAEIGGKVVLIDYKTSAQINRMLTGVQLEAYSRAFETLDVKTDSKAILHLNKYGSYEYQIYEGRDMESWEVFTSLLTIRNHINKFK